MSKLTGDKNTDFMVLMKLTDYELGKICQVNKYVNELCEDPHFWLNRISLKFPLTGEESTRLRSYLGIPSIKDLYKYLQKIPKYMRDRERNRKDTTKYIHVILRYLIEQTFIDQIINDNINKDIPKWFNKDELIYELRRKFPLGVLKAHFHDRKPDKNYWFYMHTDLCDVSVDNCSTYTDILHSLK